MRCISRIDLNCLSVSGIRTVRTAIVRKMIERPQPSPTVSWKKRMTASKTSIRGWKMLARTSMFRTRRPAGRRPGHSPRGSTGCSAAAARPPAPSRAVCRTAGSPVRHSASRWARTCSGAGRPARWPPGRSGSARLPPRGATSSGQPRLLEQLDEGAADGLEPVALGQFAHVWAGLDHHVGVGRHRAALRVEGLAQQALDAVALDGAADLLGHREAEAHAAVVLARERVEHEIAVAVRAALAVDTLELGAARQAPALGGHGQTVSRLRPLERRRLMTSRPARVDIRSRKPWVRARLRFFGW